MKKFYGIALMAVFFLLPSLPISAAPKCGDRETVVTGLAAQYDEVPVAVGVTKSGGVIEVFVSPEGETWTIIFTYPSGPSCLVSSGEAWQNLEASIKGPDA